MNILLKKTVIENAKMKFRILMLCTFIFSIEQVSVLSAECDCSVFFRRQLHKCILLVLYIAICLYFFLFLLLDCQTTTCYICKTIYSNVGFFLKREGLVIHSFYNFSTFQFDIPTYIAKLKKKIKSLKCRQNIKYRTINFTFVKQYKSGEQYSNLA